MQGFFPATTYTKKPLPLIAKCGQCGLYQYCDSPKMPVSGNGKKGILIVGEGPGKTEDEKGVPFCGKTGIYLESTLSDLGIDMRRDCWITNAVICRVSGRRKENEKPTDKHLVYCRPNLTKTIQELQPHTIIPLGLPALQSVLMGTWTQSVRKMERWLGWNIPCQKLNAWICPTWHPSYVVRCQKDNNGSVVQMYWEKHLQEACKHSSRPWKTIPKWEEQVEIIRDVDAIPKILEWFASGGREIAWDLETNCLKPDREQSKIICCGVSDGKRTIAFPWYGPAVDAMKRLLRSPIPKVGANTKFESRWVLKHLGVMPMNWRWDTMLAAHWMDNRPDICSVSFQSFVHLGLPKYNEHIEPYLEGKGGNGLNRIKELDMDTLLRYVGGDAIIEWKLAQRQRKLMGIES